MQPPLFSLQIAILAPLLAPLLVVSAEGQSTIDLDKTVSQIVQERCVACHRSDGRGPFSLENAEEYAEHLPALRRVIHQKTMPPWLAAPGFGTFKDPGQLPEHQRAVVLRWLNEGANPDQLRMALPVPKRGIHTPDRILKLESPYTLAKEGVPHLRSFVIPLGLETGKFVSAIEIRPQRSRAIAHATVRQDSARFARVLDQMDPEPGYHAPETRLTGSDRLIHWSPAQPRVELGDLAWTLFPDSDLVVDLYLVPTGIEETIDFEVALKFQDEAPALSTATLHASDTQLNISPDREAATKTVSRKLALKRDSTLLSVLPSAGSQCDEIKVFAMQRGTSPIPLVWIKDWDPQWQQEYVLAEPVELEENSEIVAEFTYHFDAEDAEEVLWGIDPGSEHAELWVEMLPAESSALSAMRREFSDMEFNVLVQGYQSFLKRNGEHFNARARLGHILMGENRASEARPHLEKALELEPQSWNVRHNLGLASFAEEKLDDALEHFRAALALHPEHAPSTRGVALTLAVQGKLEESLLEFEKYLTARPRDFESHNNHGVILVRLNRLQEAEEAYRKALLHGGLRTEAFANLANLLAGTQRIEEAIELLRAGITAVPESSIAQEFRLLLARYLLSSGNRDEARSILETVLRLDPDNADAKAGLDTLEDSPEEAPEQP